MLDNFESISPTAIVTSYPRIFTDIPYEKEIYQWLQKNCKNNDVKLNKLLAPEIEARYKLTNKILDDLNIKQVVEIAAGYSSRGLIYAEKGYEYIEMDLEEVAKNKVKLLKDIAIEHIKEFMMKIGFKNIEIHRFIEMREQLKSFEILGVAKEEYNKLLENAIVAVIKI